MSLVILLLLARSGGDTGGAEASPRRLRARGAAPEPSRWRGHDATPGAERGVERIRGEAPGQLQSEHLVAGSLSGGEPRRRGPGDRAVAMARGANTPRPPAATAAWLAKAILAFSTRLAKLFSWFCSGNGDWRARPRVARSAPQADFMPNTAARARRASWTSSCGMGVLC